MARYGFPFLVISFFVVIAGPIAVDWVGDQMNAVAERTAAQMQALH